MSGEHGTGSSTTGLPPLPDELDEDELLPDVELEELPPVEVDELLPGVDVAATVGVGTGPNKSPSLGSGMQPKTARVRARTGRPRITFICWGLLGGEHSATSTHSTHKAHSTHKPVQIHRVDASWGINDRGSRR
jgi:hypothetical protein